LTAKKFGQQRPAGGITKKTQSEEKNTRRDGKRVLRKEVLKYNAELWNNNTKGGEPGINSRTGGGPAERESVLQRPVGKKVARM